MVSYVGVQYQIESGFQISSSEQSEQSCNRHDILRSIS